MRRLAVRRERGRARWIRTSATRAAIVGAAAALVAAGCSGPSQLHRVAGLGRAFGGRGPVGPQFDRALGPLGWSARGPYRDGRVLVGFKRGASSVRQLAMARGAGAVWVRRLGVDVLLGVPSGGVFTAIARLRSDPAVRFAEPDYVMESSGVPNDPGFGLQWGLQNTGQTVNKTAGTPGADEHVVPAWGVTTGSPSVVIAETDTGVEYTHPDLAANMWSNPGGLGTCPAGTHGFNVVAGENPCDPMDQDGVFGGHGTHVAGIMGAVGNNGVGVTGVNWHTSIMAVKWLDALNHGLTSDLITALQLVVQAKQAGQNIRVVNDSVTFYGTFSSQALSDEIDQLAANDILFVTAAGNQKANDDVVPRYPCNYNRPNQICVAASDQNDQLPSWANYGANSVDLAAPGAGIYSTLSGAKYGYIDGSSMATAEVSGAAALILSVGYQSATALKADILNNVDPIPGLAGKVRTGGRLDICKALPGCPTAQRVGPATGVSVTLSPSSISADGASTATATATVTDAQGRPIRGDTVSFNSDDSGVQIGPVTDHGGGTYSATLTSSTTAHGVTITATDDSASPSVSGWTTLTQTVPPPTALSSPLISGMAAQGQTLFESHGSWANGPSSYRETWEDCDGSGGGCSAIPGATAQTYLVAASDVGHTIRVREVATNAAGAGTASESAPTAVVGEPGSTGPPWLAGGIPAENARALVVGRVRVHGVTASVPLHCSGALGASCEVKLTLTVTETVQGQRVIGVSASRRAAGARKKLIMLGTETANVTAGQSARIRVTLNRAGRRLLARRHRLKVKLSVSQPGQPISARRIVLRTGR
jgi:subtilisin family serine protease